MAAKISVRDHLIRTLYALFGVILIGLGAAVLKVGSVGLDPYTAMNVGLGNAVGLSLGQFQLIMNLILFIPVLIWGRKYIGTGTVINMVLTGFFIDFFVKLLSPHVGTDLNALQMAMFFLVGIIIFDFGASAYISAGVGTAPYDALAPMVVDRTKWSYQRVRVPQDLICLVIAVIFRGPVGFGTIMTAFFNGPLIQFFNHHVNQRLVDRLTHGDAASQHVDAGTPGDPTQLVSRPVK